MTDLQTIYKSLLESYKEEQWDNSNEPEEDRIIQDEIRYSHTLGIVSKNDIKEIINRHSVSLYTVGKELFPNFSKSVFKEFLSELSEVTEFCGMNDLRVFKSIKDFTRIFDILGIEYNTFDYEEKRWNAAIHARYITVPLYQKPEELDNISHFVFYLIEDDNKDKSIGKYILIRMRYLPANKSEEVLVGTGLIKKWFDNVSNYSDYKESEIGSQMKYLTDNILNKVINSFTSDNERLNLLQKMYSDPVVSQYKKLLDIQFINLYKVPDELMDIFKLCIKSQSPERLSQ